MAQEGMQLQLPKFDFKWLPFLQILFFQTQTYTSYRRANGYPKISVAQTQCNLRDLSIIKVNLGQPRGTNPSMTLIRVRVFRVIFQGAFPTLQVGLCPPGGSLPTFKQIALKDYLSLDRGD